MLDSKPTRTELEELKKFSRRLRIIAVAVTCVVVLCAGFAFKYRAEVRERRRVEEMVRIEERNRLIAAERAERARLEAIERERQRQIADSVRLANMPKYSISDVHEMVRTKAPRYSWVYLWRMDNDNWIMKYKKEYGDKVHWFIQRFNPTERKFEKAIEYSTMYYKNLDDDRGVYAAPKNVRCSFTEDSVWGTLTYYEDGKLIGVYSRKGIEHDCRLIPEGHGQLTKKRLAALENASPEWVEDGYDSPEDWYYDNEEDLRTYYYGR